MLIRSFKETDTDEIAELFYETVHSVKAKDYTHASLTARPFFLKKGYKVIKEQRVLRKGVYLTNFLMEKTL